MTLSNKSVAGTILFIAGVIYIFGVGFGEHYSNTLVLNSSVVLLGLLIIIGAVFFQRGQKATVFSILLILAGIGTIGVGLLSVGSNEYYALAYLGYIFFGLAAIMSYKYEKSPLSTLSVLLGIAALILFALWVSGVNLGSGTTISASSVDNLILPWLIGFGAHIIADADKKASM
jgi:uncharacterized membrane protein